MLRLCIQQNSIAVPKQQGGWGIKIWHGSPKLLPPREYRNSSRFRSLGTCYVPKIYKHVLYL